MDMSYYNNNGTLKENPFPENQRTGRKHRNNSSASVTERSVKEVKK